MLDFLRIETEYTKTGTVVTPNFIVKKSKDLMIRGGDFYAIWDEAAGKWSRDEDDVIRLIDAQTDEYVANNKNKFEGFKPKVQYMWDSKSSLIDAWHKYCQKQMRDNFSMLDETLVFSNSPIVKEDYSSKRLTYPLEEGSIEAYDKIISTLYTVEERHKIEWAIGAIVTGASKTIQKFMVLYGAAGTGKSTILNIIELLFDGYYSVFDAKSLGSNSNQFALESFNTNPLVAIQHDGDLSRIEDNTRLNSLVSHELMSVNAKYTKLYSQRFKCFLFMGTNKPVKITDGKSGLIRRLIDVTPSGEKLSPREYNRCMKQVKFELGAIACHCRDVYLDNPNYYDDYIPVNMMGASNDFYNYVMDSYGTFIRENGTSLIQAYEMYKVYCDECKVPYPMSRMIFKEELKNYFEEYHERITTEDGNRIRSYYRGFRTEKFEASQEKPKPIDISTSVNTWLDFKEQPSIFDTEMKDYPAQYANQYEYPCQKWSDVTTKLSDMDSKKLHYVNVPINHIVIDFDIRDDSGNKCFEKNLEAASKWPKTYAELSKSGGGIHLHYIYSGDPEMLKRIYDEDIEIKVYKGDAALRRRLTKCVNLPIATISCGLPLKEGKMIKKDVVRTEKGLITTINKSLNKEIHGHTKSEVDWIYSILEDAYTSGMTYDVSSLSSRVFKFCANSSNNAKYCIKMFNKMHFKSEDPGDNLEYGDAPIAFYDIEVFPNLLLVNYKLAGENNVTRMINPSPNDIEHLIKYRLVGFNCRRYDNHIIYARMMGYNNQQIYELSKAIIDKHKDAFFSEAYNLSYTDIYDFASAGNKKSLKKLEIEMGIHHQELGMKWDEPVPEDKWVEVAEYCDNDVIATEAAWNYLQEDWIARKILAQITGMTVNDTTNSLTTRFIFGQNKKPQNEFCYRDLSQPVHDLPEDVYQFLAEACPAMMSQTHGDAGSLLPYFPGYTFENGKSRYRGEDIGEGGYVYAEPGMYYNVALLDIASMHPHSTIAECLFGPRFTRQYRAIVEGRVSIKHEAWQEVNDFFGGVMDPFIEMVKRGELKTKQLANALKTAINSVYGLTSASFDNPFNDPRNKDNIVAKRGELFMVDLKHEVQKRGFTVAHIKTDSIKIPDATPEIIQFVMEFGEKYGYTFEHEATYERMCLVNNAVYIAKYAESDEEHVFGLSTGENIKTNWTATGKQFMVPYIFKSLFANEKLNFNDYCETFAATKGELYLDMNERLPDVSAEENKLKKLEDQFKKGQLSDLMFEKESAGLKDRILEGHDYQYIGKVGQFTPILDGYNAGMLYRIDGNTKGFAPGAKDYKWLESEYVREHHMEDAVDKKFYLDLANAAIDEISLYGDFDDFVNGKPHPVKEVQPWMQIPDDAPEELPFE